MVRDQAPTVKLSINASQLRDGDIVLRRGLDMMSRLVMTQGDAARFSHVGVIVIQHNTPYVIHAMPAEGERRGGAILEPLATFMSPSEAAEVAIYRDAALTGTQRGMIRRSAFAQLGLPFDERFALSDTRKVYCTALVVRAYAGAGITLVEERAKIDVPLLPEQVIPPDHVRRFPAIPLSLIAVSPS
jgi:hypothetical protein